MVSIVFDLKKKNLHLFLFLAWVGMILHKSVFMTEFSIGILYKSVSVLAWVEVILYKNVICVSEFSMVSNDLYVMARWWWSVGQ